MKRVLVVDDSLTIRMDLKEGFEESGNFEVQVAEDLNQARAALEVNPPDLIILDVLLPDGDGVEFLVELRETPRTAHLPVIMLSSEVEVADRVRGLTQGADAYIGKPYETTYVLARAGELLRRGSECRSLTVLVIDDSPTFRQVLVELFTEEGFEVVQAESGEKGLRRAAEVRPDALVVDGVMPDLSGNTVIRRLRLDPALRATPCLLLTASEQASSEVAALDAGADAYVHKSEPAAVVLARLRAILRSASASRRRNETSSLLDPKRVLAVDDSPTYLGALAEQLRDEGYEVVLANSGEEALRLLAIDEVDCILLDLMMPGLSGAETCRRIKGSPITRSTPLIILTSVEKEEAMVSGINAGADDYVVKSGDFDVLKARLRAQLRRKQFEDENRRIRDQLLRQEAEALAARDVAEARRVLLEELSKKNLLLSSQTERMKDLNEQLEMFAYSISHDLRQPLGAINGFSHVLIKRHAESLDPKGMHYLERIQAVARRMNEQIDGLLLLSRAGRQRLAYSPVDLSAIAREVLQRLAAADPGRDVLISVADGLGTHGDAGLLESVLENLLGNAWKFTSKQEQAHITFDTKPSKGGPVFYVRDNGAGFDPRYADKLFGAFQRLHPQSQFDGTGIGLATVQRIIQRHGGKIWAESQPGEGATFYFTLASNRPDEDSP